MKLIVGLGNPGKKFKESRHNSGFLVLDYLRIRKKLPSFRISKEFLSLISKGKVEEENVFLMKPQTFMNESGKAVKLAMIKLKIKETDLWVVHDDLDIPLAKLKISFGKGAAGHRGVQSIIEEIKSKNFYRFRLGISPQEKKLKRKDFVLAHFDEKEGVILKEGIKRTSEALFFALKEGMEKAMERFNR